VIEPTEQDFHAAADDQLSPARLVEIQQWLASHPGDALRVSAWRSQKEALRAYFDPVLDDPVPPHLLRATEVTSTKVPMKQILAASACVLVGGAIGYGVAVASRPAVTSTIVAATSTRTAGAAGAGVSAPGASARGTIAASLARQAAIAHELYSQDVRHPVEISASDSSLLLQWLSDRLGQRVVFAQLGAFGYNLLGGRLLPGSDGAAAQFMYQGPNGIRLTLYVRNDSATPASGPGYTTEGSLGVAYWNNGALAYALTGPVLREPLMAMAVSAQAELAGK
jgi:anti-sigma factor RsiW